MVPFNTSPTWLNPTPMPNADLRNLHSRTITKRRSTRPRCGRSSREKAFDTGQFTARALTHNLRTADYQRPLSEIRDAFWSAPRLSLLYVGDRDLQYAVYEAVASEYSTIVDPQGNEVAVTNPAQVNVGSSSLRLTLAPLGDAADTSGSGLKQLGYQGNDDGALFPSPGDGGDGSYAADNDRALSV